MSVPDSFQSLLSRIEPLSSELEQAASHAATIKTRLEQTFNLKKFATIGSHSRYSAIRTYSDADYFAVLSRDDCRWGDTYISSTTLLNKVRDDLRARFPQTDVSRDGQAVVVSFGSGSYAVDVVPGFFHMFNDAKQPLYYIPDGAGNWRPTSPESHNRYILSASEQSGYKLRRTAQLLKFWRECRTPRVPLSSFHVELLLAAEQTCAGVKGYAQCLTEAFQLLAQRECRAYRDPLGISGNVGAVNTETQREAVLNAVSYARDHAKSALDAENWGTLSEAYRQWDIVFNGGFPY